MAKINEIQIGSTTYDVGADAENIAYGNTTVKAALDELSESGGSGEDISKLPVSMVILGDSIATDAQGLWKSFLVSKFGINVLANYAQGKAGYKHRGGTGLSTDTAGTTYNITTTGLQNETSSGRSNDNVITNQVNRLVYNITNNVIDEPDIVLIHCGVNDRDSSDNSWDSDADITMYGDADTLFHPMVAADEDLTGVDSSLYTIANGCLRDNRYNNMTWAYAASIGIIKAYDVADADNKSTIEIDSRLKTMVGGMKFAIETLWAAYPAIKVIVTTPIYTEAQSYYNIRHINRAIKDAASYLSVPVIDLTYESQMSPFRNSWVSCDTLHPDTRGALYMAECIGAGLMRHFGFVAPFYKYDRTLTINVVDSNDTPVEGYDLVLCYDGLWLSGYSDGYRIKSAEGVHWPGVTDANGQATCDIPAAIYEVYHRVFVDGNYQSQTLVGTADLMNNESVTINYTTT